MTTLKQIDQMTVEIIEVWLFIYEYEKCGAVSRRL